MLGEKRDMSAVDKVGVVVYYQPPRFVFVAVLSTRWYYACCMGEKNEKQVGDEIDVS